MTAQRNMTGPQALKALIEGQAIRVCYWTPINRIWRTYRESIEEYIVIGDGTDMFKQDLEFGNAVWIVELLANNDAVWEVYEDSEKS